METRTIKFRGTARPALVSRLSRFKSRVALLAGFALVLVGVVIALFGASLAGPESARQLRVFGLAWAAVFGLPTLAGLVIQVATRAYVALTPDGIVRQSGAMWSFIPWAAVDAVDVVETVEAPVIAVTASDPDAVELSSLGRLFMVTGREISGADLIYPSPVTRAEALRDTIDYYIAHPEERGQIGTENGGRYTGSAVPR